MAPGARGWVERRASAVNTNGRNASPNAMAGPAGGALALSESAAITPDDDREVGGHEQEGRQQDRGSPLLTGRERLHARRGVPAGSGPSRSASLTAPAVRPRTKYFLQREEHEERKGHRDERGRRRRCQFSPSRPTSPWRASVSTGVSRPRGTRTPPGGRSRPTGTGRSRTASAGTGQRDDEPPEDREVVGPVDPSDSMIEDDGAPM